MARGEGANCDQRLSPNIAARVEAGSLRQTPEAGWIGRPRGPSREPTGLTHPRYGFVTLGP
jgi:hypothetical protein